MRLGMFWGSPKRNENYILEDPRPIERQPSTIESGNAGLDGFTVLSRADPDAQGSPPSVQGTVGRTHRGPDSSFEQ